jgi:hypothetical protein
MSEFLELPAGESTCWLTGTSFTRGTNDKPRNKISLFISEQPSSVSHTSPSTKMDVYLPLSSDSTPAKIAMEKRIKSVLYPIAGYVANQKCSIKDMFAAMQANLLSHDLNLSVEVSHREGKTTNREGNLTVFTELMSVSPIGFADKKPFDSDISFSDDDCPF